MPNTQVVEVETKEEWHQIIQHMNEENCMREAVELRPGVVVEEGWVLRGEHGPGQNEPPTLPARLCFGDDEAQLELQAQMEAEHLAGMGLDGRESRQISQWPLIRMTASQRGPRATKSQKDYDRTSDLHNLHELQRAELVKEQLLEQADICFKVLEHALDGLEQACNELKAHEDDLRGGLIQRF